MKKMTKYTRKVNVLGVIRMSNRQVKHYPSPNIIFSGIQEYENAEEAKANVSNNMA
jgi:hypothetical protein